MRTIVVYTSQAAELLLEGPHRNAASGWASEPSDGGQDFGMTPGHFYQREPFRRTIINAIL